MICSLKENNWCERHKTFHKGLNKDLALSDTPIGEQYRLLWDKQLTKNMSINKDQFKIKKPCNCRKKT